MTAKKTAIYPGSFDPVTNGHLDIIRRASRMFEHLTVVVMNNTAKHSLFSVEERVKMVQEAVAGIPNVEVDSYDSLLVNYCKKHKIRIVVRGLRAVTDFESELQIAQINKALSQGYVDTVFLTTSIAFAYVSSSLAKEIAMFRGDVAKIVPESVAKQLIKKYPKEECEHKEQV